ncbi:NlpC/P60 family protein [Sphingobacterium tabacisoli]|uniref:CHAP domain-containing protein n=1 Tax=Sphingobacterium tabacisoli TaxID=2044855 RepID=A0ABW5KVV0_9SPHI|nr:CHAP domain-containing protein [Sphingobacterium tabacisoli]
MATMYYLFLGFLFTALCSFEGDGSSVLSSLKPREALLYSLINKEANKSRLGQYDAKYFLTGLNISEPLHFAPLHRYVFNDLQKIFLTLYHPRPLDDETSRTQTVSQPRPPYLASASSPLQPKLMSPVKLLTLVGGGTTVRSKGSSDDFCFFLGKRRNPSGDEDMKIKDDKILFASIRQSIITIASKELGVREATGNNDGPRVEEYLHYTNLGKGYEWCAVFVSWVYGQAGFDVPRNPWSPALFPKARVYWRSGEKVKTLESEKVKAHVFGIYGTRVKRINHVGLVKERANDYLITIEGNSNDRVQSRRRHLRTVYALAGWVDQVNE